MAAALPPLVEELRTRTRELHAQIEREAYAQAVAAGTLPLASYRGFLQAMATLFEALEGAVATAPTLGELACPERLARLRRDLGALDDRALPESPRAQLSAEVLAAQLRVEAALDPGALLGWVYVLEGSALGNLAQRQSVAQALRLDERGLEFLRGEGPRTRARFAACLDALNAAALDAASRAQALQAAETAFRGMAGILDALVPLDTRPPEALAMVLNPEAGRHAVPAELREIVAALRAGERTWRAVPYYAARYGARGLRFTRSDSAWLAALGRCEPSHVLSQVRWLAKILAARGMPSLLLEEHLELLHAELGAVTPGAHTALRAAAEALAAARTAHLKDADFVALERAFDERVAPAERERLPRVGRLLAAAVADAHSNHPHAISSLVDWLTDPGRFSEEWRRAVRAVLALAQAQAER